MRLQGRIRAFPRYGHTPAFSALITQSSALIPQSSSLSTIQHRADRLGQLPKDHRLHDEGPDAHPQSYLLGDGRAEAGAEDDRHLRIDGQDCLGEETLLKQVDYEGNEAEIDWLWTRSTYSQSRRDGSPLGLRDSYGDQAHNWNNSNGIRDGVIFILMSGN